MENIYIVKPYLPPFNEYIDEIKDIWEISWLTNNGPKHQLFSDKLKDFLNVKEISLFSNGHLSLESAFSTLPKDGEVITTPFTFASTTLAIMRCGLTPVFCDIEPEFYTIDTEKIESLITEKTVAIAPHSCLWKYLQLGRNRCDCERT